MGLCVSLSTSPTYTTYNNMGTETGYATPTGPLTFVLRRWQDYTTPEACEAALPGIAFWLTAAGDVDEGGSGGGAGVFSTADGALVSGAILLAWASAWVIRKIADAFFDPDEKE